MAGRKYFVYILSNASKTLYIGVTGNLPRRLEQHRAGMPNSFTTRYNVKRLVYAEEFGRVDDAIRREKQLKRWLRARKIALIESVNPEWRDLEPS